MDYMEVGRKTHVSENMLVQIKKKKWQCWCQQFTTEYLNQMLLNYNSKQFARIMYLLYSLSQTKDMHGFYYLWIQTKMWCDYS